MARGDHFAYAVVFMGGPDRARRCVFAGSDNAFKTVDITRQYDDWADFPQYPLNPVATANAIAAASTTCTGTTRA